MTKLNLVALFVFAVLAAAAVSIEPAAALIEPVRALHLIEPAAAAPVPGPIIGAGLPVLAILAGGYWVVRKFRDHS
jgi:hypothetical protein